MHTGLRYQSLNSLFFQHARCQCLPAIGTRLPHPYRTVAKRCMAMPYDSRPPFADASRILGAAK